MTRRALPLVALCAAALFFTGGCRKHVAGVSELTVAGAASAHAEQALFVDANNADFRKANGKVPGAVLLANYRTFDPAEALPVEKEHHLVFYCSNKL